MIVLHGEGVVQNIGDGGFSAFSSLMPNGKKLFCETGCSATSQSSARRQTGEQSVVEVGGVGQDLTGSGCIAAVRSVSGGQRRPGDLLTTSSPHFARTSSPQLCGSHTRQRCILSAAVK